MAGDDDGDLTIQMGRVGFEQPGKHGFFLNKAKEAEEQAAHAADAQTKEQWLKVASGYRNLAGSAGKA